MFEMKNIINIVISHIHIHILLDLCLFKICINISAPPPQIFVIDYGHASDGVVQIRISQMLIHTGPNSMTTFFPQQKEAMVGSLRGSMIK